MKHAEFLGGRAARTIAYALYAVLIALFVLEFVDLNNAAFILYSFLAFIALGVFLGVYSKHTGAVLAMAMVFIAVSSVFYVANALFLQFVWINLAIVGYYLLISAVIGIFIATLAESSSWQRRLSGIVKRISRPAYGRAAGYAAIITAVALLIAPIWPSSQTVTPTDYTNTINYTSYYGNATNATSYTLISDPLPYNYTIGLCANGTNASAAVSVRRVDGIAYAFLFGNESAMQSAAALAASWPFPGQVAIYRAHASSYMRTDNSTATGSVAIPDHGCAYMVLLFRNLSTVRVAYNISYFGLLHAYKTERVPIRGATMTVNGTSNAVRGMQYLGRTYAAALLAAELNGTAPNK